MILPQDSPQSPPSSTDARRFRALVECSSDAIFLSNFDSGKFEEFNQQACRLFGFPSEEMLGKTGRSLHPPDRGEEVDEISRELVSTGKAWRPAVRFQRKDGTQFVGELRAHCYEVEGKKLYVTFIRDLSLQDARERELQEAYGNLRETQSQLVHSARLAAVGQLAAGIAHEVNNPAAYVMTNLEVLAGRLSEVSPHNAAQVKELVHEAKDCVSDCLEGLERIAGIVKGLKAFARIDHRRIERLNVNEAIETAVNLVRPQTRHAATVRRALHSEREIVADRGRLVQVFVNLLLNAAQAIDGSEGDTIFVDSRDTDRGTVIRVADNGPGIPPAYRRQIFEPFFTTKPADIGTGLGLSLCSDILNQHASSIRLDEQVPTGTCFELHFPCDTGLIPAESESPPISSPHVPRARLLIIDDEVPLVRAYRRSLGQHHDVTVAFNGQEALAILSESQDYDVILCDLMMPGLDGVEVYEAALKIEPTLRERFVFCTGGATSTHTREFVSERGIHLLEKPVDFATLNHAILEVIRST